MNNWKTWITTIGLCFSMSSAYALPEMIRTYHQLVEALENGNDVKAIIHLDLCDLDEDSLDEAFLGQVNQSIDGASTRFNFNQYVKLRLNSVNTVTTSQSSLVEQSPGVFLNLFSRLSIYEDPTRIPRVHIELYDPKNNASKWVLNFECGISNGRDGNNTESDDDGLVLYYD
jgi:hypothetical protein